LVKARDIRASLHKKVDPDLLMALASIAEDVSELRSRLNEVSSMTQRLVEIVANFVDIADNMKRSVESQRRLSIGDGETN
jgi:chemotaxis regulatin CheY-phosphate phosphatase CheZ